MRACSRVVCVQKGRHTIAKPWRMTVRAIFDDYIWLCCCAMHTHSLEYHYLFIFSFVFRLKHNQMKVNGKTEQMKISRRAIIAHAAPASQRTQISSTRKSITWSTLRNAWLQFIHPWCRPWWDSWGHVCESFIYQIGEVSIRCCSVGNLDAIFMQIVCKWDEGKQK